MVLELFTRVRRWDLCPTKFIKFCIMGARTQPRRDVLLGVINFVKCICLNYKVSLSKYQHVFVQIRICIYLNIKMLLSKYDLNIRMRGVLKWLRELKSWHGWLVPFPWMADWAFQKVSRRNLKSGASYFHIGAKGHYRKYLR